MSTDAPRFLRQEDVISRVGYSKSTIRWLEKDVNEWMLANLPPEKLHE